MGFLATHVKATVVLATAQGHKLLSLFVKLVPLDDPMFMALLTQLRFDLREVQFFAEVVEELKEYAAQVSCPLTLPIPRYVFSTISRDEPKSLLAMYDASEDGFSSKSLSFDWDLAHLTVAVETLALIHATSKSYMLANELDAQAMEEKFPHLKFDMESFVDYDGFHVGCINDMLSGLETYDAGKQSDEGDIVASLEEAKTWRRERMIHLYKVGEDATWFQRLFSFYLHMGHTHRLNMSRRSFSGVRKTNLNLTFLLSKQ
jgi:hypothetical protein